ncbi:unnamed protein product [Leptidea sinapis]|uniref:Uncharacterized protein n=1 Tax=Leptidea sinapis TaxID=189913 RepID=A0A5E4QRY3_9NEOP|nr:unnamed protein product [Leptidea sinapis]
MKLVLYYLAKMAGSSTLVRVKKSPNSLYDLCLTNLVNFLQKSKCGKNELRSLPDSILMDVYFKAVIEHGTKLATELSTSYLSRCRSSTRPINSLIHLGLRLAETYNLALQLLGLTDDSLNKLPEISTATAESCSKAIQTEDEEIESAGGEAVWGMSALQARLYKEFSTLFFVRCDYSAAYAWGMRALAHLNTDTPPKIMIEVLRACGTACVVKRRFCAAGLLVRQGVALARRTFGPHHPRYASALLDYGFYLLNNLVPQDHLLLASAKRVKALILEEIALDTPAGQDMREPSLLEESEALHKAALDLSMMAFGEKNVQTAKHYGNLGRLYQSMQKFQSPSVIE